jgi:hypothetical protein
MNAPQTVALSLLVVCAACASAQAPSAKGEGKQTAAVEKKKSIEIVGTAQSPAVVRLVPPESTEAQRKSAADEKDEHTNNEYWTRVATVALASITFALAAGTVFVAGYTRGLWRATRKLAIDSQRAVRDSVLRSREEFRAEHRPWLAVEFPDMGMLWFLPDEGYYLQIDFKLKNTGRTPALRAWPSGKILFYPNSGRTPAEEQRSYADGLRHGVTKTGIVGRAVFPHGEALPQRNRISVSAEDLASWHAWNKAHPNPHYAQEHPEAKLMIVGCVEYQSPVGEAYHQTGFIFEVHRLSEEGSISRIDPSEGKDVSVRFTPSKFGNGLTD